MREKRLIDANEAVRLLRGKCVAKYPSTFLMGLLASASEVEQLPTVDAVEVVRCKGCKYCDQENLHCDHPMGTEIPVSRKPDDFCSYGERKDND